MSGDYTVPNMTISKRFVLEGGVGSGKSTLIRHLASTYPHLECFLEPILRWQNFNGTNYLDRFYADPCRENCKALQRVIISSYRELMERPTSPGTLAQMYERSAYSAVEIFSPSNVAKGYLSDEDLADLQQQYREEITPLGQVDGWVYLRTTPELCYRRMKQRGYPNEGVLDMEYARVVHECHEVVFGRRERTLILDEIEGEQSLELKMAAVMRFVREGKYRDEGIYVARPNGSLYRQR